MHAGEAQYNVPAMNDESYHIPKPGYIFGPATEVATPRGYPGRSAERPPAWAQAGIPSTPVDGQPQALQARFQSPETKLHVLLMQLPVPNNPATNVPLAAGYLKAHAQARGLLGRIEIDILPRALADHAGDALLVAEIVARRPDVLGISLYTWNSERSLAVAARVKVQVPNVLVVVGGPEVQRDNEWVLRHPAVDVAVIGEGEQTFCEILQIVDCTLQIERVNPQCAMCNLQLVPALAFRNTDGDLIFTPERVPLNDLAPLPSPYLLGYLEPSQILMVEISRWCPYSCGFPLGRGNRQ
jgi:hypothetical protein